MFQVTAISSTLEGESRVALGLLGFFVKICQPCFLQASCELDPHSAVFLHPIEDSHNDKQGESLKTHKEG